ncbi:MAG: FAD-binding oxidoreductase [Firmicutes bacterium]|nr:FAD-binding oxidoreductase [Bacillota bacterium]
MSAPGTAALARLADLVGADHVLTDPLSLSRYAVDGRLPWAAVRPGTAEEVAEIVRWARAETLALVPTGSGTKLDLGMPPLRYDVAVDCSRLDRIIAYDPADLTLSVEAGMRVAALEAVLARHGQMLPLEMPFYDAMTIGGLLASGSSGPQRQLYGAPRDFLLGAEFVTGEGRRAKSGGRVVKNVTGYDFHRLLIGSLGSLAIFTVANFRTFPRPPAQALFVASFAELDGALALRRALVQSPLTPTALELVSPALAQRLTPQAAWLPSGHWAVLVLVGGERAVVERHAHDLARMARSANAAALTRLDAEPMNRLWSRLREFPSLACEISPAPAIVRLNTLPSELGALAVRAETTAGRHRVPVALLLRGVGILYVLLLPDASSAETLARLAAAVGELLQAGAEYGSALVEFCPPELKQVVNVWGVVARRNDLGLMRQLKQVFDPDNVLSPGRHIGGI